MRANAVAGAAVAGRTNAAPRRTRANADAEPVTVVRSNAREPSAAARCGRTPYKMTLVRSTDCAARTAGP